jgi:hypothetical protein
MLSVPVFRNVSDVSSCYWLGRNIYFLMLTLHKYVLSKVSRKVTISSRITNTCYRKWLHDGDCVNTCEHFAPNSGDKRTGCCIMTTHHLTFLSSPWIFFTNNYMTFVPPPILLAWFIPLRFFLFPRWKISLKGRHFYTTKVTGRIAGGAEQPPLQNTTSRMHLKMTEALGTVNTRERGLLRGLRWTVSPKLVSDQMSTSVRDITDSSDISVLTL